MKPSLALFVFLLLITQAFAQQFMISGTITDDTGQPVPFASVLIKNTTKGTSANSEGRYTLQVAPGGYDLVFKAIGYTQQNRHIDVKGNAELNARLETASYQLSAVVIRPGAEDPAYAIIRKAISKRKNYLNEVNTYSCRVYLKGLQKLLDAPKHFLGRDMNEMARQIGLDSNRRGIVYLSESESKLSYLHPGNYHEEMISSKVSGSNRAFSFNRASDIQVNFYENLMNWPQISNRPLVSPIADNALSFYHYKWLGSIEENGENINKIQLIPKHSYDPVFSGTIYIIENSWRIHSFDVEITKSANLNIVDTLKVREQYIPVGHKNWMPASVKFEFKGAFLGFKFGGYYMAVYRDYNLAPVINKKDFDELMRVTKGVNKKDSLYWEQQRPVPLTDEEKTDYKKKAILAAKRESKPYLDSLDRVNNSVTPGKLLLTGITVRNRYEKKLWQLDPLLTSVLFNTVEGVAVDYGGSFVKQIDSINNKYLRLGAHVRYGFSNHLLNGGINGTIPMKDYTIGFNIGATMEDMNSTDPIRSLTNTYNSLLRRRNLEKLYEKKSAAVSLSHRIAGGWVGSASAEYADRKWYPNSNYFSFYHGDEHYTSNNPFTPDLDVPLFPQNQSFKINIRTSYNFSNKYVTYPTGRYYLPSDYPRLELSYTKGIKNVFSSDADYDLLQASLSKNDIPMGRFGRTSFYLGAGKFLNNKQVYYTDYAHFLGNQSLSYSIAPNRFILLELYDHSTPDQYFEGHLEHNFSGFFLNNIPLIRKLKLQEIVNINYLVTPQTKNYLELAAGAQWYTIRVMGAMSFENGNHVKTAIRLGLELP